MSDFKATASQRDAIDTRGSAVLVSAGAGSGKTKVLTERLMSYVCVEENSADLDSFLIITFTRAAAAELRGRISQELAQRLALQPGNRRLRRQNALCQRAQIGTIHSFCSSVLRENCHLLGLSPDFKIVDDERAAAMKAAALERVMEKHYTNAESCPGFLFLADTVGAGRDDRRLAELVLEVHEKMQCHARPELWARKQTELLKAPAQDAADTPWGREILEWAAGLARYWAAELDALMGEMRADEKIEKAYMPAFSADAEQIRELCRRLNISWDSASECLPIAFEKLGSARKPEHPELAERLKGRRKACKEDMEDIAKALSAPSSALLGDMAATAPAMEALLELTLDFDREYTRSKRDKALVDYSDLEHLTAKLLTDEQGEPTPLARQLSRRYTEVMVDEYQDVSRVQDEIFRAVSDGGKKLFMVGDVKQSIYRFRLAEPEIFNEKYRSYKPSAAAAPGEARKILLRENFRSRREVLEGANSVFSLCMSRRLGDMDYDEDAALICGADYPGTAPKPELLLLETGGGSENADSPDKTTAEAELVASRIHSMMAQGAKITDRGMERPLEYGDVAILLRSANTVGEVYRRVLADAGIPVASAQGSDFFSTLEVSAVTSVLALLDDPHQDIPLIAALRSPAFGFTADKLAEIRAADRDRDLYTALLTAAKTDADCALALEKLQTLRRVAPDLSAAELTWQIITGLDLLPLCSAMADGEQRRANLMELIELSEKFESTGYRGLHRYVLWLKRLAEKGQEVSSGAPAGSAVQIMSIHRSKGLEFPVVFLSDTARRFNRADTRGIVLVHPELGLGAKRTDLERRAEYPTLARNAISRRLEREMLSEEMRLLYVALTRPKERLIITAAGSKMEDRVNKHALTLRRPMAPEVLSQAGSFCDWLICAALADEEKLHMELCLPERSQAEKEETLPEQGTEKADPAELERRLGYVYPHARAVSLPSKITATELKGRQEADTDAVNTAPRQARSFRMPELCSEERPLTPTEKGVATHLVLQYMDFSKAGSREGIESEIARLREMEFLSAREAEAVDAAAVEKLFSSPLGRRILSADEIKREFKFSLLVDAEKLYPGAGTEKLLMQGVIDCCIREGGELTVIDYKTDRVRTAAQLQERAEHYRGQLTAYAEALERMYGRKVKECVLYFIAAGKAVKLLGKTAVKKM